jgi:flagellar motor switch protein FliM
MRIMKIDTLPFEISVLLGKTDLNIKSCLGLQVGDIIPLEQDVEKGLIVRIGSDDGFLATAGLFETHKAVIIDERIYP